MRLLRPTILPLLVSLLLAWTASALGQGDQAKIQQMLVSSYDLLEAGKLDQARSIFAKLLKQAPDNPLVLNNLAAVLAKEQKYGEALNYLEKALPRARGYRVKVNRVCGAADLCLAFRPAEKVYGDQELAPLVQLNLEMVKARLATKK
ncbi:MAG: tetratricopeptide repeat protein [Desulfobaccales bacterium]